MPQQIDGGTQFTVAVRAVRQMDDVGQLRHERVGTAAVQPVLAAQLLLRDDCLDVAFAQVGAVAAR